MPQAHAAIGGSAIERILRCPGSVALNAKLPRTSSAAADRGTMLHKMMERVVLGCEEPHTLIGQSFAGQVLEARDARAMLLPARAMLARFVGESVSLRMEVRVRFAKNVWGTADALAYRVKTGYMADFKFGEGAVPAEGNEQLMFYSAAALEEGRFGRHPRVVHAAIIQPPVSLQPIETVFAVRDLQLFAAKVRAVAAIALAPGAPLNPGEVQCKWCPAKRAGVCPAVAKGGGGNLAEVLSTMHLKI